jgi:catecholate siderophore receptor
MLSLRAGAVYKPRPNGSIYASYGTSLNPSLEGLAYQTGNVAIDPEKTYSVEAGSKWDLLRSRILLSGAVFRVDKTNARTPGLLPDDPPQVLQGEQMVKGIELGVTGTVTRNWQVFTAYTFLDTEIVESNVLAELGKELPQTPRNSASIWTSYRLFRRVTAGAGIRFVGRRFSNTLNTRRADSYRLADAMVSFPVTDWASVQLNIYNLANSYYFERLGGGHLIPGAARSATITLRYGF